jgi:GNAT superfamily N-acetyltransferase
VTIALVQPDSAERWAVARRLVEEYAASLRLDLGFQDFDREVANLAREYGPPDGAFLLAEEAGGALGGVGLRRVAEGVCEMKRLYVVPDGRGRGVGRRLAEGMVARGRELGYRRMVLDTLPAMREAQALYVTLGFRPTTPYRFNPVPGASFLELAL